ncbi:hypothetical protein GCM10027446_33860 [Angustibacter peucedani]
MPRSVRLLVLDDDAEPVGVLGPLDVESRWWPDVEPVVAAARDAGAELVVLRLLSSLSTADDDPDAGSVGGHVVYLAQLTGPAPDGLGPTSGLLDDDALAAVLADHPLRLPYARPGGPQALVAWADEVLAAQGRPRTRPVEQVKTWNLSSILRLPTADGPVWCKSVPPFFRHEGAMVARVADRHPHLVPPLLAADDATGTVLLADVPGEDQWAAPTDRLLAMVETVVELQDEQVGRVDDLLALGLPDWRGPQLAAALAAMVARADVRERLDDDELDPLDRLVAGLPDLVAELDACGLPDTLVHGDLHPGNWRHGPGGLLLLDWGDSGVGNPLLDQPAFLERVPDDVRPLVRQTWTAAWARRAPDADVARAGELVRPLATLRQALIYRTFLDQIEPDEQVYHREDVPFWLRRAVAEAAGATGSS